MTVRVLVVDDSAFFRRRISEVLSQDGGIEVIGTAANGSEALDRVTRDRPDVVTMDVEMPVMDGISAVREIMSRCPTPVLMFSSLTRDGARATLDALDAGAMDFMPKRFEDIAANRDEAVRQFCLRVRTLAQKRARRPRPAPARPERHASPAAATARLAKRGDFEVVAIGASTGGPVALQRVLTQLPATFSVPLLVVQHMPANFTATFAERLNQVCAIRVKEAEDGDVLRAGTAYIAPGGRQMLVKRKNVGACLLVADGPPEMNYKPCVDLTFRSLAAAYPGKVLAVVMTGMGADGCEGARLLKLGGATVWAQDEASSVVFGMPQAVSRAGLADRVLGVDSIGANLGQSV